MNRKKYFKEDLMIHRRQGNIKSHLYFFYAVQTLRGSGIELKRPVISSRGGFRGFELNKKNLEDIRDWIDTTLKRYCLVCGKYLLDPTGRVTCPGCKTTFD